MKLKVLPFVVCLFALACTQKQDVKTTSDNPREVIGIINKDSTASPVITFIGKTNAPKTISAGRPEVRTNPNSDGLGAPTFTNYNTEQGLALSSIACGYRDKLGNLWFGTLGGGVSRYDGKSFINFSMSNGLPSTTIYSMTQDNAENLWFGTAGGGLSRYDGKTFTNFSTSDGLVNNFVRSIKQDKSGDLWIGTSAGVSRYDGITFTNYTAEQGLANYKVSNITEDKMGYLWFATDGGGVSRYDGKSFINFTTAQGLASNFVYAIKEDKTGNLWFGTMGAGVSRYDGRSFINFSMDQGLASNMVWCITEDKNGNLWFGTNGGGVSRYDGKSFTNYNSNQGLANVVHSITEDKNGNLWFGTMGRGVSRYDGKSFTHFTTSQGLANNAIWNIIYDKTGNLWFATNGGGVSCYDGKSFTNFSTTQGLANNIVSSITEDKSGNLWFATYGGVSCFDGKLFTNFTADQGLAGNTIYSMTQDKAGKLWFGTNGGGVSRYDGKSFTNFNTAQGLVSNVVYDITEDKNGNLWFATNGGVSCFDGKLFTNFTTDQGLANNFIISIAKDKAGNLWFGTNGGGVSRYDGKSFINFTTKQGLADDVVYDFVFDSQENIFIGTNLGFSVLKGFISQDPNATLTAGTRVVKGDLIPPVNTLASIEIKNYKPVFEHYNNKTGYPIKDLRINAMFLDSLGIIWAGTDNQVVKFDFNGILKNTEPPTVLIQSVKIRGENVSWYNFRKDEKKKNTKSPVDSLALLNEEALTFGSALSDAERDFMLKKFSGIKFDSITRFYPLPQNLVLPYNHNSVTFDFVAIEPARHFLVRYQYILEGYDRDWSPVTDKTSTTFGNIHEGVYTFKLKARSPDGVWSQPVTYTFKVLPPRYRTWWAYLLYAILFIGSIWGFIHYRSRSLRREKRLLEEKVTQRTTQLSRSLEELKQTQAQLIQSEKMASLGELTAGIAHEIQNPLNFVNNFSEINFELINELKNERIKELSTRDENFQKEVIQNIEENSLKINQHGKRADAIVKGMLLHSQKSSGTKELTNINALADEYLRLAYHGYRARDQNFSADLKLDLDPTLPLVPVIPQDMGRVLLNLFNNAFWAVNERLKWESSQRVTSKSPPDLSNYTPSISLTTKNLGNKSDSYRIEIRVKDNGLGIPQHILDKIFQPFFTTKPTGQGTGLGLSLAYDIVNAHKGELLVDSQEGEYSEFILRLPMTN